MQTVVTTVLLHVSYLVTAPRDNVNWVYGPSARPQTRVHPLLYVAGLMLFFPLYFQWPAHALLRRAFEKPHADRTPPASQPLPRRHG